MSWPELAPEPNRAAFDTLLVTLKSTIRRLASDG
jgi:hypothetical protein